MKIMDKEDKPVYLATVQRLNRLEIGLIICGATFVALWGSEQQFLRNKVLLKKS